VRTVQVVSSDSGNLRCFVEGKIKVDDRSRCGVTHRLPIVSFSLLVGDSRRCMLYPQVSFPGSTQG